MRLTFIRRGSSITSLKKNAREFNSPSAKQYFSSKGSIFKSAYQYLESVNRGSIFQARINSTNSKSRRIDRFASFCRFANPEVLQIGKIKSRVSLPFSTRFWYNEEILEFTQFCGKCSFTCFWRAYKKQSPKSPPFAVISTRNARANLTRFCKLLAPKNTMFLFLKLLKFA